MRFDELFEKRVEIAQKLKTCIRERGYTKVSFSKKCEISRPTLDRLLNGEVDNKSTFDKHLRKILHVLNMSAEDMLDYVPSIEMKKVEVVYSLNAPEDYVKSAKAEKQYDLLMDVVDLCAIYY